MVEPARQVVRRQVVQIVGSRHSSLSSPSTTVTATTDRPWPWAGVTCPAGQPSSQASTAGVASSGTRQASPRSPAAGGRARAASAARLAVSSASAAGGGGSARRDRRRASRVRTGVLPGWRAGRRRRAGVAVGPAPLGSPQRMDEAARRAPGHAQDAFRPRSRARSLARVAHRCGMTSKDAGLPGRCQGDRPPAALLYRIATIPCCCGCHTATGGCGHSVRLHPCFAGLCRVPGLGYCVPQFPLSRARVKCRIRSWPQVHRRPGRGRQRERSTAP